MQNFMLIVIKFRSGLFDELLKNKKKFLYRFLIVYDKLENFFLRLIYTTDKNQVFRNLNLIGT
jgi:hypothetical protein